MKVLRLVVITVVVAALACHVLAAAAAKPGESGKNAAKLSEPQQVVLNYYEAYIARLNYDVKKGDENVKPVPDRRLDPAFVTRHYIDSYNRLMAEDQKTTPPGEIGFLDHDPILCAQDYPDNLAHASLVLVKDTGTEAVVKTNLSGQKSERPFTVKLKKLPEGWRLDAVMCGQDDFDSLYRKMVQWSKKQKK
jgi:hypothetical protein